MRNNSNSLKRIQSIKYVQNEDDHQILTFGSLDKGNVEEDGEDRYRRSGFIYNSEEDIFKLKSLRKSKVINSQNTNLGIIKEDNDNNNDDNLYSMKEDEDNKDEDEENDKDNEKDTDKGQEKLKHHGADIIFANLININFKQKKITPLYIIVFCYLAFCIIELICGYYSASLTLMADAAHYFSESSCFAIYIVSIYVSRKNHTNNMSFGFHRGEIIGVLVRATFLFGFSFWLLYYVGMRLIQPKDVGGLIIIIIGIISTFFNLMMGLVLLFVGISNSISFSGKKNSCDHQHENCGLNCDSLQKTFTNVILKSIQSCVIILAGILVYFLPHIKYIDPICTLLLTGILLYDAYNHMEGVITVLMEGSPLEFDVEDLKETLKSIEGVKDVHDIHVWSLSIGKISMSCHLITEEPQKSLVAARDVIKKRYNITHSTIQVELYKKRKNKQVCSGNLH